MGNFLRILMNLLNGMELNLKEANSENISEKRRLFKQKNQEFSKGMNWIRTYLDIKLEETLPPDKARDDMLALLQYKGGYGDDSKIRKTRVEAIAALIQEANQWLNDLKIVSPEDVEKELKKALDTLFNSVNSQNKKDFDEANSKFRKLEIMFRYKHNLGNTNDALDLARNSCVYVITSLMNNQPEEAQKTINELPAEIEAAKKFIDSH